jgi:signal peptidase I
MRKNLWLAVNLSLFFPGLGQIYAGQWQRGSGFCGAAGLLIGMAAASIFQATGQTATGLICGLLAVGLYIFNLFDAHACVYRQLGNIRAEKIPRVQKDPWFAVFVSRILPGLGHLYAGSYLAGALFSGLFILFASISGKHFNLLFIPPLIAATACYQVFSAFHPPAPVQPALRRGIVISILTAGLITTYLPSLIRQAIDLFEIPSNSMVPTLQVGDRVFVDKTIHRLNFGDIIVFQAPKLAQQVASEPPSQSSKFYIKRVIGLPGQTIRINAGQLYINDRPQPEPYLAAPPSYELPPQTVPPQSYFVLGDHRNDSFDSHVWGFLPANKLVGRAYKIYFPFGRVRSLLAYEEFANQ